MSFTRKLSPTSHDYSRRLSSQPRLHYQRVQNRFLTYAAFFLKIYHFQHNYSLIGSSLRLLSLTSRRIDANNSFITSLLNSSIDSP